jgi:hypothetical protein
VVSATDDKTITISVPVTNSLVKRAFLADGTPLSNGDTAPKGTVVKYLIYLNNQGGVLSDMSAQDPYSGTYLFW